MSGSYCDYHPDKKAIETCEECGKLICIECKKVVYEKKSRSNHMISGMGTGSYYVVKQEFCPVCYYTLQEKKASNNPTQTVTGIMVFFMIGLFMIWGTQEDFIPFMFTILIILVPLLLIGASVLNMPKLTLGPSENPKAIVARNQREKFLKNLRTDNDYLRKEASSKYYPSGFCSYCGEKLEPGDIFCSFCGEGRK
ncbi:MAG: zinc-ribbon domain-containing protein [Candidatus Heimdallarchaeota archaeon]|nr:zinc-ribbon domain-containing protein [Candidatus Heimdallarchaeota archaeon]MCK5049594.1 zinc-ribbon domain-containing protein [Candidatus Heimdallarchaeota archaeon]